MQMNAALFIFAVFAVAYISNRISNRSPYTDFDLAGMNEKFSIAENTRRNLNATEQLASDLQLCTPERQIVLHLEWLSDEEQTQYYDLFCDGYNIATDRMREIIEREIKDLRKELSYECSALEKATRSRKKRRIYGAQIRRMGEWMNAGKDVRDMWSNDSD